MTAIAFAANPSPFLSNPTGPGSQELKQTKTLAQGGATGKMNTIVIDSWTDQVTPVLTLFAQLPYMYAPGIALSLGSPGPTDLSGATNYAFQFPGGLNFWVEAGSNTDAGNLFLNANGDGTTHEFPFVQGRTSTLIGFNTLTPSAAAITLPNDFANGFGGWLGAGSTPPANIRLFLGAQLTTETNALFKAIAAQTGFLLAIENASNTIVSGIGPDGGFLMGNNNTAITVASPGWYMGSGVPSNTLGANGSRYARTDTPATAGQRDYIKSAGAWLATAL